MTDEELKEAERILVQGALVKAAFFPEGAPIRVQWAVPYESKPTKAIKKAAKRGG